MTDSILLSIQDFVDDVSHVDSLAQYLFHFKQHCINNGILKPRYREFIVRDEFRADWHGIMRKITQNFAIIQSTVLPLGDQTRVEKTFALISYVSLVYLLSCMDAANVNAIENFKLTDVTDFLVESLKCIKPMNKKIKSSVQMLKLFLELPLTKAEIFKNLRNLPKHVRDKCDKDTIFTLTQYLRLMQEILLESVQNEDELNEMFEISKILIERLQSIFYVKFCDDCAFDYEKYGGIHELCDVISFAVKLFERGIRLGVNGEDEAKKLSEWLKLKIGKLKEVNCARGIQQKKEAATELIYMEKLCAENDLQRFNTIIFNDFVRPSEMDFLKLNDVELLDVVYSMHQTMSDRHEILMQMLYFHKHATPMQREQIEKRCIEFVESFFKHLAVIRTPSEYFEQKQWSNSSNIQKSPDIIVMSTVWHRCANQFDNIPTKVNARLIEQILNGTSPCLYERLQFMLSQPFYEFDSWLDEVKRIMNTSIDNCSRHRNNNKSSLKLLEHAVEFFENSKTLRLYLAHQNSNLVNFERTKNENSLTVALMNAARDIDTILHSHVDNITTLNTDEIEFCFRAIHFIKDRLNLFNFTLSYKFTSIVRLANVIGSSDALKLKLATILARFNHEYKDDVIWDEQEKFITDCGKSVKESKLIATKDTLNAFSLNYGLMLKRMQQNGKGTDFLTPFIKSPFLKIVHLEYFGTKDVRIAHDYFEAKPQNWKNILSYITSESIKLTDTDLRENEKPLKLLSAALKLIFVIDRYNLSAEGTTKYREMLQHLLNICQNLGLIYQSLNLLLIRGSFELNVEPEKLQETLKVVADILSEDIHVLANLKHLDEMPCTNCFHSAVNIYHKLAKLSASSFHAYFDQIWKNQNVECWKNGRHFQSQTIHKFLEGKDKRSEEDSDEDADEIETISDVFFNTIDLGISQRPCSTRI